MYQRCAFRALECTHTHQGGTPILPLSPTHPLSLFAFSCPPGVPLSCCHFLIYSLTLDVVQDVSDRDGDKAGEAGGGVSTDGCGEEGCQ